MDDASAAPNNGTPPLGRSDSADESPAPKRAGTFVYPLPGALTGNGASSGHSAGSHAADRDDVADEPTDHGTDPLAFPSLDEIVAGTNGVVADRTPTAASRRNSMGVASVRIAARLAHTELAGRAQSGAGDPATDPTIDADELLTLLGEYLVAGGFENPELRATLGGQEIVVDLLAPRRTAL